MVIAIPENPTVVVLGGGGGMGQMAAQLASNFADLGELVVADLDLGAAQRVVAQLEPAAKTSLRAVGIDVTDSQTLHALLQGAQVVLNTTGPFFRLGTSVLQACIGAKCHYIDICDDWEPTLELLDLHEKALAAGILAIIGLGASPGVSNLMGRLACGGFDQVDDLYTAWPVDAGAGDFTLKRDDIAEIGVSAAIVHWMQQISGSIEVIEGGERVSRPPLQPVALNYPGLGRGTAYTVGHPEPVTLHQTMQVKNRSANLMVLQRTTAAFLDTIRREIDAGTLTPANAAAEVNKLSLARLLPASIRGLGLGGAGALPGFFALARGQRGEQKLIRGVHLQMLPEGMAEVTSVPMVIGLRQLLDGRFTQVGVYPPESVVEIEPFFDDFLVMCKLPASDRHDLVIINEMPAH